MKKDKVTFLKEKQIESKALKSFEFNESAFIDNPIKAKFLAFQKAKKDITFKDLL